jgi:hypothetical protein
VREALLELGVGSDPLESGLGQRLDLGVDRIDVPIDALADRARRRVHGLVRMKAVPLPGSRHQKGLDPPREGTQRQNRGPRRLPRFEVHPAYELEQRVSIGAIGLRSPQLRACEVLRGARVCDHDLDPLRLLEGKAQIEVVDAGRFDADASPRPGAREPSDELPVAGCVIAEGPLPDVSRAGVDGDDELLRANVDAAAQELLHGTPRW